MVLAALWTAAAFGSKDRIATTFFVYTLNFTDHDCSVEISQKKVKWKIASEKNTFRCDEFRSRGDLGRKMEELLSLSL